MSEPFSVRIKVRHYELDTLGHLNHAVYHQYGEVARLELMEHAGGVEELRKDRLAVVLLETNVAFRREIRAGETVDVTCKATFGEGKTFHMDSEIRKLDGTVSAEITCTLGLMDLDRRKLVAGPRARFEEAGCDLAIATGR